MTSSIAPFIGRLIRGGWEDDGDRKFVFSVRVDGPVEWPLESVFQQWSVIVSPTPDGVIKERGEDGRDPSGPGSRASTSWIPQAKDVLEAMQDGGHWRSCTGCHETCEGHETGDYPYSPVYQCYVGSGCHECGGIGVIWEPPFDEAALVRSAQATSRPPASQDLATLSSAARPGEWCGQLLMEMTEADSDFCDALVNAYRSGRLVSRPTPPDLIQAAREAAPDWIIEFVRAAANTVAHQTLPGSALRETAERAFAWAVEEDRALQTPHQGLEDGRRPEGHGLTLRALHEANKARQTEWCQGGDPEPDLAFRGNELAGEVGEACNVVKKLERERHGWRGSRATLDDLAQELADVVICADLCAVTAGIDLDAAVVAKFNATSAKQGLATMLPHPDPTIGSEAPGRDDGWQPIETAPKDGTEILLWARDGLYAAAWLGDGPGSCQEDWHTYDGYKWHVICSNPPTAWMPQPASPRSSQKEEGV